MPAAASRTRRHPSRRAPRVAHLGGVRRLATSHVIERGHMNWIELDLYMPDVDAAVDFYVRQYRLFTVENCWGSGLGRCAMLRYRDTSTPLRLNFRANPDQKDTEGLDVPAARQARIGIPLTDFISWAGDVFGANPPIESTPWGEFIVLRDPWGHLMTICSK